MSEPANSEEEAARTVSPWGKVFWMFAILIFAGLAVFFSFIWLAKQGMDLGADTAVKIAKAFRPEEVVETFNEWRELEAKGTNGNILEVATATATEKFTRQTNLEMFGMSLPLGTTVSEISVPATYRFHIDLLDGWFVTSDGNRLLVLAPEIRPSLPVAFDTGKMRKKTQAGWARWDGADNLDKLEKTITTRLGERAQSKATLKKVRAEARLAVAKFLKIWLLNQGEWGKEKFEGISVMFSGEKGEPLSNRAPVLRWKAEDEKSGPGDSIVPSDRKP